MNALVLALALAIAPDAGDTLRLAELQEAAVQRDPRARQLALQEAGTRLRLRSLDAERLPQLRLGAEATRQSESLSLPLRLPGVPPPPEPSKERVRATLDVDQRVYDPTLGRRRSLEEARLAESRAVLGAELFGLREEVNEAFFAALLLQERGAQLDLLIQDLEARLELARARVRGGVALPGDAAAVEAELLRARQERDAVAADRRAARAVLGELTGRAPGEEDVLALPDLAEEVARARAAGELRARPEHARFARARERLEREAGVTGAATLPRVSAFGQAGYGHSPRNPFLDELEPFGVVGVRLQWTPWDWGETRRQQEQLRLQQQVLDTQEAEFAARLERRVQDDLQQIARLEATLETDDRIVELRERIARQTLRQVEEGVRVAAEYVDARTDVFEARVGRFAHRVELARARARYLTTLGLPVR
ncbi:MAG TPA: TolC family protein [Longimicrobiaceae bacterium]|nr:TolC family protein [Longimicrobiaceae bacterium]